MSITSRLFGGLRTRAGEPRGSYNLALGGFGERALFGHTLTPGRQPTYENVTGLAAVWAAVWLIADQGGSLPLNVYLNRGGELQPKPDSWQSRLLRQPNPEMSGMQFFSTVLALMELWGNAYIGKEKVLGRVVRLWIIRPDRCTPRRDRGVKVFDVAEDDGSIHTYTTAEVIHIAGRSLDGLAGASPIHIHRSTLGVALALDDFGADTFKNRAVPLGVLSVKGRITDPKVKDEMRAEWKDRLGRRGQRGNIAILDEEAKFDQVSMPLVDAQYVEQRNLSVRDIARIFGVSPEDIGGDSGGSMTYSNVQARRADLLQFVLWSRLKRVEGALFGDLDLFSNIGGLEPHFDDTAFLRGDPMEQFKTLQIATGNRPILTQDEARARVGAGPLGGSAGELATDPATTTPKENASNA